MKRIVILALSCALATLASAQTLYKSVDKNGKVVYSDTPPTNADSKAINVQPSGGPGGGSKSYLERDKELGKARDEQKERSKKAEETAKTAAANDERCVQAKAEYQGYADGGRLVKYNEKGERIYLGDAEIETERVRSQKAMEEACKK